MAARPQISVQSVGDKDGEGVGSLIKTPAVLTAPIRCDIVRFVHGQMARNKRQPYAVNVDAGMQHSAESWGTGRAVSRIPRVSGSGTSRAAQGAFGNMCRKGRMFAPTKTWRRWHRKINLNQKRFATVSALSASALPSLVMARGHRIDQVAEVPLVVPNSVESVEKTKKAIDVLKSVGGFQDVEKARDSKKARAGIGKTRNRRWRARRGPLIVYNEDHGITRAFRNLPGVELCQVDALNLLQLAPGGHLGRFIVWTKGAFEKLDKLWGSRKRVSELKKGYRLPANIVSNSDISRIINSDEVQSKLRAPVKVVRRARLKKNPLKNLGVMVRLNPYTLTHRRSAILTAQRRAKQKQQIIENARAGKKIVRTAAEEKQRANRKKHEPIKKATFARISAE